MDRIYKFLSNCPNWQLRIAVGLTSLVIVILAILATHGSQTTLPLIGELSKFPGFLMFFGSYATVVAPEFRGPNPSSALHQTTATLPTTNAGVAKRPTNNYKKHEAKKARAANRRKRGHR